MAETERRHDSLDAIARRTAKIGNPRHHHRELPDENLPCEPGHGPGSVPPPVQSQRQRNRTYLDPPSQAAASNQNTGTREGCQSRSAREELLALHERSVRQPETPGSIRDSWI